MELTQEIAGWNVAPLAVATRGTSVESVHFGVAAVVDCHGQIIAQIGNPDAISFSRSSLKPFQAMPSVVEGFPHVAGLSSRHLAIACGSHGGQPEHVATVLEVLASAGFGECDLLCGVHEPSFLKHLENGNPPPNEIWNQTHNNCSGKHATMLWLSKRIGGDPHAYLNPESPVQQRIKEAVIKLSGVEPHKLTSGTDGCSVPNYAMPISNLALAYARLCAPDSASEFEPAYRKITDAMSSEPMMVSGIGRFDLALTEATHGKLISKVGGEAMQCVGFPNEGLAVCMKIADGNVRAIGPAMVSVLLQLGWMSQQEAETMTAHARTPLYNHRGIHIGDLLPVAQLNRKVSDAVKSQ